MYHILTTRETQASLQAVFVSSEAESLNMIESSSYGRAVVCMVIMVGSKMPTLALKVILTGKCRDNSLFEQVLRPTKFFVSELALSVHIFCEPTYSVLH